MKYVPKELKETADISRGSTTWQSFLKNVLSVVIILGAIYFLLGLVADLIAVHVPEEVEARLFSWNMSSDNEEPAEFQRAQLIFERLLQQPGLRPLPYKLFLLDMPQPNAVAVPGGGVGVSSALLEAVPGEIGLAMVLGHELGHHQGRHSLKRLGRGLIYSVVMVLFFGENQSAVVNSSFQVAESSYSRSQEREADEFGLRLVYQSYGHTQGALEFFEIIQREFESDRSRWSSFFASHPLTPDRIAYLRELQISVPKEAKEEVKKQP